MTLATDTTEVPRSIGRVLDLMEIVLAEVECNLTTAAILSDLTPTTALRHLRALEARGYVSRNVDGQFSAGPTLFRIAAGLRTDGPIDRLIAAAQPYLDQLAESTGESTYLAVGDGRTATYVAAAEGTHAIRHVGWVGQHVALDGTAVGAALGTPGKVCVRDGAVEADITALSLALPTVDALHAAVSVLGPAHRMKTGKQSRATAALQAAVASLVRDLRLEEEVAS
jgi:DNA-binding IclR family transcriptional regulator